MAEYDGRISEVVPTMTYVEAPILDADENAILVLESHQTTTQHMVDTATWVYSSQVAGLPFISAGSLGPIGTRWLVRYSASYGGSAQAFFNTIAHIELISKRTAQIPTNYAGGEADSLGNGKTPEAARANYIGGWFVFVADGTDLEFRMQATSGFPTYYAGLNLIAIAASVTQDPKKLLEGTDFMGSQGLEPTTPPVSTIEPYASVWEFNTPANFEAGNYLVFASCQAKTTDTNVIQARLLIDDANYKISVSHRSNDNRDIMPFIYESQHALSGGVHTIRIEGGSGGGVAAKLFSHARIYLLNLNKFERWAAIQGTLPITLGDNDQYPSWGGSTTALAITPFSSSGEFILAVGNCIATRTTQCGVMARIYNATVGIAAQEYVSYGQVANTAGGGNPADIACLSSVGCEVANIATTYQFQQVGQTGLNAGDVQLFFRELALVGLYKKSVPGPPTVFLTATDGFGTAEAISSGTGPLGPINQSDSYRALDFTTLIGTAPPIGIPNTHPRLWLTPERLSYLRSQAGYDDFGNQVNPPGSPFWIDLNNNLGSQQYALWNYALRYKITQNPAHLSEALSKITTTAFNSVCDTNLNGYESNGLRMGVMVRQAAFFYDWLYDVLPPDKKLMLRDYILGISYFALNNGSGVWTPDIIWSRNDPYNNYFMSWHEIGVYTALALYHDVFPTDPSPTFSWPPGSGQSIRQWVLPLKHSQVSGPTYTDGYEYIKARFDQIAVPVWSIPDGPGSIVGGGWHEGSWYRPMWITYETFRVMMEVAGYSNPLLNNVDFRDYAYYLFHSTMPGSRREPELGDSGTADRRKELGGNERCLMMYVADKFRNEAIGRYAQWWLNHVLTSVRPPGSTDHQYDGADFLFYDDRIPESNINVLSKFWFSRSNQLVISRSGWDDFAHAALFHSQDRLQLHEHGQENDIQIWSGRGGASWDDRWLVGARCAHGSSGENQSGDWRASEHSTYVLGGVEQRYSGEVLYPGDVLPSGHIDLQSSDINGAYVYARGNASDAYRITLNDWNQTINPNKRAVDVFHREYLHLPLLGIIVLYDRIKLRQTTPDGTAVPQTAVAHFHWTKPQPVVVGDVATLSVGTAKLYQKFLYPNVSPTWIDEAGDGPGGYTCFDQVVNVPVSGNYARLMTVFEVETSASPGMSPMTKFDFLASVSMEGAVIDKGGVRYHIAVTSNQTGAEPPDPFSYETIKTNDNDVHIVIGLASNQTYFCTEASSLVILGAKQYTFVKAAIGLLADDGGVLMFTPSDLTDQSNSVIDDFDTVTTIESTSLIATKFLVPANDIVRTVESTILQTANIVFLTAHDTLGTTDAPLVVGPVLGFDTLGISDSAQLVAEPLPAPVPTFDWIEKVIDVGGPDMVPIADELASFFTPEPNDGSFFDKVADDDDTTYMFAAGPNAEFSRIDFTMSSPGDFIGRIDSFKYVFRVSADLQNTINARIEGTINGLGLQALVATFRSIPIPNTIGFVDLESTTINHRVSSEDFANMRLSVSISGSPIGGKFICWVSKVKIVPLSVKSSEKEIS